METGGQPHELLDDGKALSSAKPAQLI